MGIVKLKYVLLIIYSVAIVLLLASVIHSGYSYLFDPDELVHVNVVFLLQHNLVPYRDFFITYTPFFHWILMPISSIVGYTFHFLETARIVMIVLFIVRIGLLYAIARKLFGHLAACVGIALFLFDPFTVFAGMQVRPDNLMMTLYLAGVLLVLYWYLDKKTSVLSWAGLLLGASAVTLLKNVPATFVITVFVLIELLRTRQYRHIIRFTAAMAIPALFFAIWAWYKGIFPFMVQQIFIDAKYLNDTLKYPENILNYYWPPNFVLYGFPGRPVTWMYELCLPLFAFAGLFTAFLALPSLSSKRRIVGWFTAACTLQWVSLLFVRSVFIQYFLSVSWFLALFAAYALTRVYQTVGVNRPSKSLAAIAGVFLLIGGLMVSWKANDTRSRSSYAAQKAYLEAQWRVIPESALVFPGTLFRMSTYPLIYGTNFVDLSPRLAVRYGSPSVYLSRYHIPYVVIDGYNFTFLDVQTQKYIKENYQQNPLDQAMWVRGD